MKQLSIFVACAAVLFAVSCAKEDVAPNAEKMVPVSMQVGIDTKTTLDGTTVNWVLGDQIKISVSGGSVYTLEATAVSGSSATFTGTLTESDAAKNVECVCYPVWDDFSAWWSHPKKMPIPEEQPFVDGSFASGVNPAVAFLNKTIDNPVTLSNMGGLISVRVTAPVSATRVTLTGNTATDTLSGVWQIEAYAHKYEKPDSWSNSVSIVPTSAEDLTSGKTFVFVAHPGEFASGITISIVTNDGKVATKTISKGFTVARARKVSLPNLTLVASDFVADPAEADLTGAYTVVNWPTIHYGLYASRVNSYTMTSPVALASDLSVATHKFYLNYNGYSNMYLFFDSSSTSAGISGCYALENLQDRSPKSDDIPTAENLSYYDQTGNLLRFNFVIHGYWNNTVYSSIFYHPGAINTDSYDLTGDYSVEYQGTSSATGNYYTTTWDRDANEKPSTLKTFQLNGTYRKMTGKVELKSSSAQSSGVTQKYQICYADKWSDGILFFDLTDIPMSGHPGCYRLGNFRDRVSGDTVVCNESYFDPTSGQLVFDFAIANSTTVYAMSAIHTR